MGVFTGGVSAGTIYANLRLNSTLAKDSKEATKHLDKIITKFTMMGVAGAAAAVAISAKFVKMAAEEEVVSRRTAALLKAQGIMWEDVSASLDAYLKDLERLTAYNDTDLQESFNTLIVSGMTYAEAIESMNTVTSMSYSLNRDLVSMAMLVGKAYNGQTGELSRYGIVLDQNLDKSQKFSALQSYVNDNFADAADRTDTLTGQMDVLKNSMFNVAEAMGAELMPDLISGLEDINKWGDEGGWQATSDALSTIADSMIAIGYSIAYITDTVGMAYHGIAALKDEMTVAIDEWGQGVLGDTLVNDADLALTQQRRELAAYHRGKYYEEAAEFQKHFEEAGERGARVLFGYEPYVPPEKRVAGVAPPPGVTPPPTVSAIGGRGGPIPAFAGRGRAEREAYGGLTAEEYYATAMPIAPTPTVYAGAPTAPSPTAPGSSVAVLMDINQGIVEGNGILREVVTAVNGISIRAGGGIGGIGAVPEEPVRPGAEIPPNVYAVMKKTYDYSGLSALRF